MKYFLNNVMHYEQKNHNNNPLHLSLKKVSLNEENFSDKTIYFRNVLKS